MAEYYIEVISQGLTDLHKTLSSQGFIDYKTESFLRHSDEQWDWDDFFVALAWEGLKKTTKHQTKVVDKGLVEDYKFYTDAASEEGAANSCE